MDNKQNDANAVAETVGATTPVAPAKATPKKSKAAPEVKAEVEATPEVVAAEKIVKMNGIAFRVKG